MNGDVNTEIGELDASTRSSNSSNTHSDKPHAFGQDLRADAEHFREKAKQMVDYIADYLEKDILQHPPFPTIQPNYLAKLLPPGPPQEAESFDDIMQDVNRAIMPGVSPHNY
jgi:hypothetical protein